MPARDRAVDLQPSERGGEAQRPEPERCARRTAAAETNVYGYDPRDDAFYTRGFGVTYPLDLVWLDPRLKGVRAQVKATNVFDHDYTTCIEGDCYRGQPLRLSAR